MTPTKPPYREDNLPERVRDTDVPNPQDTQEAELREKLRDLFFDASGGVTDMANEEVETTMQLIHQSQVELLERLLSGRHYLIGEGAAKIVVPRGDVRRFYDELDINLAMSALKRESEMKRHHE